MKNRNINQSDAWHDLRWKHDGIAENIIRKQETILH